ncbi:hypothetical protein TSUD_378040 [Trifolium subterraneum]|uniref:Uncharacterized protein n=1 Tax=Trifolium subterraneum TaxID=3900 RepID=A0A2Z6PFB5_TRISU|nr:hypothetical protein TSUD_378040 [Trifolium subterraneum]
MSEISTALSRQYLETVERMSLEMEVMSARLFNLRQQSNATVVIEGDGKMILRFNGGGDCEDGSMNT